MKRIFLTLCFVMLFVTTIACTISLPSGNVGAGIKGSGTMKTENRDVSGFDQVVLAGIGELNITQGQEESLQIEAEDNLLEVIETKVQNRVLYIGFKDGILSVQPTKTIVYTLVVKELTGLTASGAGNIQVGDLKTEALDVEISGAGSLKVSSLEASLLAVNISGAGSGEVNGGKVDRLKLEMSGAGSFRAPDLKVGTADVSISGLGSAHLWVTDLLDVQISGTGSVEYYGMPKVTQLVSGLGGVKSLGDHP